MDFALSEEQAMLQEQMGRALADLAPPEAVAAHIEQYRGFDAALWAAVADLGIPGLLVPEEAGGLGMTLLDAALVSEMMGRHVVPTPFFGSVVAAPLALLHAGSPEQRRTYLPRLAGGTLRVGLAVSHALAGARSADPVSFARGRLTGTAQFAIDMGDPELILVADSGGGLYLVAADAPGLQVTRLDIVDRTRTAAALSFDGVVPEEKLPGDALERVGMALHATAAADLIGAAGRMLEIAVDYARIRRQFGRPIGSFQAVKHLCADMAAAIEPGRALVWFAAHAQDKALPDGHLATLQAKAYMADAARLAARNAVEVHGGIGITEELRLHHWFKRISFTGQLFGGPTRLREAAAKLQISGGAMDAASRAAAE